MNLALSMPPLQAVFKEIHGAPFWCCAVRGCKGKLAQVVKVRDNGRELDALELAPGFIQRGDIWVYDRNRAWHGRARPGEGHSVVYGEGPEIYQTIRKSAARQQRAERRAAVAPLIERREIPLTISCPACKRLCKIISMRGVT